MKVLVVHNRYRSASPSGENSVVADDIAQLRAAGCDVTPFIRDSDHIAQLGSMKMPAVAAGLIYAPEAVPKFKRLLDREHFDVVHLHNPFPLISPWVVRIATQMNVPVVQTVHNHRHTCISGTHFRNGHPCFDCATRGNDLPGVQHGCYRESRAQSALMAMSSLAHRTTWARVRKFLAVSDSIRQELIAAGVPTDRVSVKPNTVPDPGPPEGLGTSVLFAGRLVREKGIELLLDAWKAADVGETPLVIVGDGPLRPDVEQAAASNRHIRYAGLLPRDELQNEYREAKLVVVPSIWPDPMPLVGIEALAHGRPILVTNMGGLPEIAGGGAGVIVEPEAQPLAAALGRLVGQDLTTMSAAARRRYDETFSEGVVTHTLLSVYGDAMKAAAADRRLARPHRTKH